MDPHIASQRQKARRLGRRPRAEKSIARTQRALEILRLLQSGQPWSSAELAERFGCSSRTISRDVQLLRDCGVAISQRGSDRGLRLSHDFFWQPVRPTVEELTALVIGTRLAARSLPKGLTERLEAAVEKLLGATEPATRAQLSQLQWRIDAPHLARVPALPKWEFLPQLLDALVHQSPLACLVAPSGPNRSEETIVLVPERISGASGDWVLVGITEDQISVAVLLDRIVRIEQVNKQESAASEGQ
jgi:predicted DNA-binding transcriptional regulator YafY